MLYFLAILFTLNINLLHASSHHEISQSDPNIKIKQLALNGDAIQQTNLATFFYEKNDYKSAAKWYKKAAKAGISQAQVNLGVMYSLGRGVSQNYKLAAYWYKKSAKQGNSSGQANLAGLYSKGNGVDKNYKKAAYWYKKAANQGDNHSQTNLGLLYLTGKGVQKDVKKSVQAI